MAKQPRTEKDFENLSDEDFLKLDEADYSGNLDEGVTDFSNAAPVEEEIEDANQEAAEKSNTDVDDDNNGDGTQSDESDAGSDTGTSAEGEKVPQAGAADPMAGEGDEPSAEETAQGEQQPGANAKEEGKTGEKAGDGKPVTPEAGKAETPAKAGYYKLPEGMDAAKMDEAVGFFQKISVPFKADGKDFTIRSPEDAIRLMQQGVNYSRRMQELKPMKALNRVLQDNDLADQNKLNFAIDLMRGDKAAITQLLKSHKIDPMDLDTEKDSGYQARNYAGNPQDHAFRDALDEAVATPEGSALVNHIHNDWDVDSKRRLREDPSILGNLQQMKASGVYDKVVDELNYQKSMGYLVGVPFLKAFDQVGLAMKNAGVFNEVQQPAANGNPMAPLAAQPQGQPTGQPVASGARKSSGVKKPETNPHLSSTPQSKQTGNQQNPEPDYGKMSDEEFLKMAPPE